MEQPAEKQTGFFGTYFDRDVVIRLARFAGVLAWCVLGLYLFNVVVSTGQTWLMFASGGASFQGVNIFDKMSIPILPLTQLVPGLLYFTLLKTAQQVLLILLDMEDNSRRAARK